MNYCKLCGKPLTLTPEYDMCMECQGKQHQTFTIPDNRGRYSNKTEMTPKKTLHELSQIEFQIESTRMYDVLEHALTELEELKRDVKRYFELDETFENTPRGSMDKYDFEEYDSLLQKLLKVGKKE